MERSSWCPGAGCTSLCGEDGGGGAEGLWIDSNLKVALPSPHSRGVIGCLRPLQSSQKLSLMDNRENGHYDRENGHQKLSPFFVWCARRTHNGVQTSINIKRPC